MSLTSHLCLFTILIIFIPYSSSNRILQFRDLQYSNWNPNETTYVSSKSYDAKGMAPFYKTTNQVLDTFIGKHILPDGYIVIKNQAFEFGPKADAGEWNDLLKHYWGILLIVAISVVIIVIMPIIGLCFCCCRCAGACGGRSQPFDKKHDTCRRVVLGILLIMLASGMVFGVVIAYATTVYFKQGIENVTYTARQGVDDTQKFLRSTSSEFKFLLVNNFDELSNHVEYMLEDTADVVITRLEHESKAISLSQLDSFANKLPQINIDLNRMKDITNGLRVNASQLSDGLRGVKRELLVALTKCGADECKKVLEEYEIGRLDVNGIDYNQLPDVTNTIESITALLSEKVIDDIKGATDKIIDIKENLNTSIYENVPRIHDSISVAGRAIHDTSDDLTYLLDDMSNIIGNQSSVLDSIDAYLIDYKISAYHYYGGLVLSSILLIVLLCIVFGLMCGICGKRPDGYGDDCCNKGSGSRFLMCGVAIIFLTISVLAACVLAYFLIGLVLHRGICVSLSDPANDEVFEYVNQIVDLNEIIYPNNQRSQQKLRKLKNSRNKNVEKITIPDVIVSCHENNSIYEVFKIQNYFDVQNLRTYPSKYGIEDKMNELLDSIDVQTELKILTPEFNDSIQKIADSELKNFEAHRFTDNLNETITKYDLNTIATKLEDLAEKTEEIHNSADIRISLRNQALHLRSYQINLVTPMTDQTIEMMHLAEHLDETIKFNKTSFEEAINTFKSEIYEAEKFINENGTVFVRQAASELISSLRNEIDEYLNLVIDRIENDIGRCGPLSNVYKSLMVAGCNRVIDPFNGFWAGVSWCILLFLPAIIVCVKLATLYQKSDPYPGPLVESEYLYDAYSERDNIPLANGPKNKRRKKNERRRTSRDRRGDYYEDTSSPHHGSNAGSRDARYNDMAPNDQLYPSLNEMHDFERNSIIHNQNNNTNHNNINKRHSSSNGDVNNRSNNIYTITKNPPSPIHYRGSNDLPKSLANHNGYKY